MFDNVKTQVNMEENAALPNMFRTLPALKATERHLMDYLDSNDPLLGLGRVSMYLWDRQRSIRQDMAWQRMEVSLTQCSSVTELAVCHAQFIEGRMHVLLARTMATATPSQPIVADSDSAVACAEAACL